MLKRSTSRSEIQNVQFGETKGTRNLIVAAKAYGKKGIVISTVNERVPDLHWSNRKGVFQARLSAKFSPCERTKPKESSATRKQPYTKALQRWFKGNRDHPKLLIELGSVSHVVLTLKT